MTTSGIAPAACLVLAALLAIDWLQTLQIAKNPNHWFEKVNPFLGAHPSTTRVHVWFAFVTLAAAVFVYFAPALLALLGLGIGIAAELWCVINNFRLGIKP